MTGRTHMVITIDLNSFGSDNFFIKFSRFLSAVLDNDEIDLPVTV